MPVQRVGFYILLTFVTIAFIAIILPFYSAVFWALVFAIVFFPLHVWVEQGVGGRPSVAAAISVLICVVLVIVPGLMILGAIVQEGNQLYQRVSSGEIDPQALFEQARNSLPEFLRDRLSSLDSGAIADLGRRFSSTLMQGGGFFAGRALVLGQSTLQFFIMFGVMLYVLFFLFRDGRRLGRTVRQALPLSDAHTRRLSAKFTSVVRATVRGNLIIALVQGVIGGVTFWALGIQPAFLLGALMTILSLLPAVGAAIVWLPVAIYCLLVGSYLPAIVLVLVGVLVIGLVDNLLRPPLVGKETKLPDYVVLISTIGGISLLGMNGFVIGPLFAALFVAAWGIFIEEQRRDEADIA
ncbi:AI-2E family transporter [Xaviernesmea oryzae]|uniref:AI-2E family transporter n=1 Tax=Xaviernesmea oryzae TaxID=464029 RepID=A0A1Q9AV54_9HYPH|nr:AI-2E family transporter [Xaviernesmea oryzae]OLP59303.1 AI-2E family transporter [Xaviernesmea oryzae]SEK85453.1 Predicted PurR-regulated permease PerM [Xaviernesmea oryzae]